MADVATELLSARLVDVVREELVDVVADELDDLVRSGATEQEHRDTSSPTAPVGGHSSTVPVMQVATSPPIQIVPESSRSTWTRPSRPSEIPCRAT